jgi:virginiamycin B lyase
MRSVLLVLALTLCFAADKKSPASVGPKGGVKTPGVLIPIASLKPEEQIDAKPDWIGVGELAKPVAGVSKPCGGTVTAFDSIWIPSCESQTLFRVDPKKFEVTAKIESGIAAGSQIIASTTDSIWLLTDKRTTLARIDPETNHVVAEIRLEPRCQSLVFGESALWLACPDENKVVRVNPETNLVEKRIEVSSRPISIAIGEGSIWVLCEKDGKVDRIDAKSSKVTKSIDLQTPGAPGAMTAGAGQIWITQDGYPLARVDPQTDKVVQQFWGAGGGAIQIVGNALWLSNLKEKTIWRIDPKRVLATLAE